MSVPAAERSFRRVYYYTPPTHLIENLKKKRLKLSRFSDVNDKFELEAVSFSDAEFRALFRKLRKERIDRTNGFISFSRSWQNSIMWAHYGGNYDGACLGFDVDPAAYFDVRYASSRLYPGITKANLLSFIGPDQMEEIVGTKHTHWAYEEEVRVLHRLDQVDTEGDLHFVSFGRGFSLREVFLGPDSQWGVEDVKDALSDEAIRVIPTRLSFKEFKIVRQKKKSKWKLRNDTNSASTPD